MNNLLTFDNQQVEVLEVRGTVYFNPYHIADILDIKNVRDSVSAMNEKQVIKLTNSDVGNSDIRKLNNAGELFLTESGVYKLIFKSRKPNAERFANWVTDEVLPSIRKHGAYMTDNTIEEAIANPDFLIRLATELKNEKAVRKELEEKADKDKPKVLFADAVSASHTSILIGDLAKLLKQNGYDTGQNRLFEELRKRGYLIKAGTSRNMPTQTAMERGLFEVKESTVVNPDGSVRVTKTTKVTGKGQQYFINLFLAKEN